MRQKRLSVILAGIWFILAGLTPLVNIQFTNLNLIMALLAVSVGILLLMGR